MKKNTKKRSVLTKFVLTGGVLIKPKSKHMFVIESFTGEPIAGKPKSHIHFWRLKSRNGETIASSEGYRTPGMRDKTATIVYAALVSGCGDGGVKCRDLT